MTAIRLRPALRILALALLPLFSCLTMFGQLVQSEGQTIERPNAAPPFRVMTHPREYRLQRGRAFNGDVRTLPQTRPQKFERPEFEEPEITPVPYPGTVATPQAS